MRSFLLLLLFPFALQAQQQHIAGTDPVPAAQARLKFKVADEFEVQLVASEPDIGKPMQMAFDAKGRLWVTSSNEYPFPAKDRPGHDKIFILDDFGPDGKARKVTTFADDLNIPLGILPLPDCNSCIVYSIPNIWKLTDTKGTGKYDKKEILYGPFGYQKDCHGMVNSFVATLDGWVHANHGFSNDSAVKGTDGQELQLHSGSTFRFRLDGSHIEIWTRGQVNPFGMTMDPYGQLYNADCHSRPITQLIPHAVYTSFGKPHDGLGFGPDMIRHDHGSTALCGLTWFQAETFPAEYQNDIFLGNVVTNRVHRDKLVWHGSTPTAVEQKEFMTTEDPWFRPVDIKLGLDGALYVADFYNRIIGHYEVPLDHPGRDRERGRIWRVVPKGKPLMGSTDLKAMSFDEVVKELESSNIVRRYAAGLQLVNRLDKDRLAFGSMVRSWLHAEKRPDLAPLLAREWSKYDSFYDDELFYQKHGKDDIYRSNLWQSLICWNTQTKKIESHLPREVFNRSESSRERRAILDVFTLAPDPNWTIAIIDFIKKIPADDTHMRHAARIALREQLNLSASWNKLKEVDYPKDYFPIIADVCLGTQIPQSAAYLASEIGDGVFSGARLPEFLQHIARYGDEATLAKLKPLAFTVAKDDMALKAKIVQGVLKGFQQRGMTPNPTWYEPIAKLSEECLQAKDANLQLAALDIAGSMRLSSFFEPIAAFVQGKSSDVNKIAAIQALSQIDSKKAVPIVGQVLAAERQPMAVRLKSAQTLGQLNSQEALAALGEAIKTAPSRLDAAIATALSGSKNGCEILLQTLEAGKASPRLLQTNVIQNNLEQRQPTDFKARVEKLTAGLPSVDQKIQQLIAARRKSQPAGAVNVEAGKELFTKNCAICHQIAGVGAKVGPNLDGIGTRGLDRLLEDVLDPNRNVDAAFRMTTLLLKDGKSLSGLVVREEGQSVVIADQTGKENAVAKESIEERKISNLSPMPANFAEQVSEAEFRHLMGYLLNQRKD